jgi:hypothetical protein
VFDTASIAHAVDKPTWKRKEPTLPHGLPTAQMKVLETRCEAIERRFDEL